MRGGILKQRLEGYEGSFSLEQGSRRECGGGVMLLMAQRASNVLGRTE